MKLTSLKSLLKSREILFSAITGLSLLLGIFSGFILSKMPLISLALFVNAYFFGSYFMLRTVWKAIWTLSFDVDLLMFVAAIGAAILGKWEEGSLLLFLFSLGHALEKHALEKANRSIAALAELSPQTALVKKGETIMEIPADQLQPGDRVVIKPNTKISADGVVVKGTSSVDQSSITGESIPVDKFPLPAFDMAKSKYIAPKHQVFSGTMNGDGYLEAIATKAAKDTTLAQLIRMVHEARQGHSPTQRFTRKFEKYFVPSVLSFVFILNFAFLVIDEPFSASFYRAISVLVVSSPCALVISTPSAILSAIARAARQGVLIKGGEPLENLAKIKTIAFDKTGTLTKGKPRIAAIVSLNGNGKEQLMQIALSVETKSDHPLARAIVEEGFNMFGDIDLLEIDDFQSVTGKGVTGRLSGEEVRIGNAEIFEDDLTMPLGVRKQMEQLERQGNTCILIKKGDSYEGIVGMIDTAREESLSVISELKKMGISKMVLLTGDNQRVADAVGKSVGVDDVWGNLLPEDKVEAITSLKNREKRVAMVGDGVNDAPAMAHSTISIAMGAAGSDVALETADIALMTDKLNRLPFAIGLSRMTRKIITQNLIISLGVILVMIPLTFLGIASIGPAVLIHEGSTVVVVFNALRLLGYKKSIQ